MVDEPVFDDSNKQGHLSPESRIEIKLKFCILYFPLLPHLFPPHFPPNSPSLSFTPLLFTIFPSHPLPFFSSLCIPSSPSISQGPTPLVQLASLWECHNLHQWFRTGHQTVCDAFWAKSSTFGDSNFAYSLNKTCCPIFRWHKLCPQGIEIEVPGKKSTVHITTSIKHKNQEAAECWCKLSNWST